LSALNWVCTDSAPHYDGSCADFTDAVSWSVRFARPGDERYTVTVTLRTVDMFERTGEEHHRGCWEVEEIFEYERWVDGELDEIDDLMSSAEVNYRDFTLTEGDERLRAEEVALAFTWDWWHNGAEMYIAWNPEER
jgi:hypothetical protein